MRILYLLSIFAWVFAAGDPVSPTPRIVFGWNAPVGVFVWQASLQDTSDNDHFCGGTVVGKQWILTSGKCADSMDPSDIQVLVGSIKRSSGGTKYNVDSVIVHEKFDNSSLQNDIALLKLEKPMEYNDNVNEIELDDQFLESTSECLSTGWGYEKSDNEEMPDNLKVTQLYILPDSDCKIMIDESRTDFRDGDNMCSYERSRGLCVGDQGGPVILDNKLVGVISSASGCGSGYPEIHMRISAYADWIREHIKDA